MHLLLYSVGYLWIYLQHLTSTIFNISSAKQVENPLNSFIWRSLNHTDNNNMSWFEL